MAVATAASTTETVKRKKFAFFLLFLQVAFIVLYAVFAKYSDDPTFHGTKGQEHAYFPAFQDTHLLVFVGFGLLIAFLKRYAFCGFGFHLLLIALVLQWGIFLHQIILTRGLGVFIGFESLVIGDFAAMAVLVSFGAVMGKLSPMQLTMMAMMEVVMYVVNKYIGMRLFEAADVGHSMYVHVFGAYFGMMVSRVLWRQHHMEHPQESRTYMSDMFTMMGTLFLWVCFPGFNAAMAPVKMQQRAVVNTVFSLCASTITMFIMTTFLSKDDKFCVTHMQNAALAGGVGMGVAAHMMIKPYGALIVGMCSAIVATIGYTYIQPCLAKRWKFHDTRGVHNLHGLVGIVAGVVGIIIAAMAKLENYDTDLYRVFPAMAPTNATSNSTIIQMVRAHEFGYGDERTSAMQAGMQAATLAVTIVLALFGGFITGIVLRFPFWGQVSADSVYDDKDYWNASEECMPAYTVYVAPVMDEKAQCEEAVELKKCEETAEEPAK